MKPFLLVKNNMKIKHEQTGSYYQTLSEEEREDLRDWLKNILHQTDAVEVTFQKKDGTNRIMNCTLKEGIVVPYERLTDDVKKVNHEVCPVWDIDINEWRSFRYESITKISFEIP